MLLVLYSEIVAAIDISFALGRKFSKKKKKRSLVKNDDAWGHHSDWG